MTIAPLGSAEWLETDGLGGFAMGTASGVRSRRYHGLLVSALNPPTGRAVLVSGFDAWIETPVGRFALSTQRYREDMRHPDGETRLESFDWEPWPTWRWRLPDGALVEHDLFMPHGAAAVCLRWTIRGCDSARLLVRPFLAMRDYHCLQHENSAFRFDADVTSISNDEESRVAWQPYADMPSIVSWSNGCYQHEPNWYRQFLYAHESERGLDCLEDLATPGILSWDLSPGGCDKTVEQAARLFAAGEEEGSRRAACPTNGEAIWLLSTDKYEATIRPTHEQSLVDAVAALRTREAERRGRFADWMHRSADQFLVQRGEGTTIIAGYPWFTDWGRDTFIALRGLCLATGRPDVAESILLAWAGTVSEGMLPNRFPDHGEAPEFNSVDASLWFVIAVHEFLRRRHAPRDEPFASQGVGVSEEIVTSQSVGERSAHHAERDGDIPANCCVEILRRAVREILEGYARGTRFGIRLDADGLIAAGAPGVQLTWMDAKVGDWVVTPRIGKPVEIQALWLNALWLELQHAKQVGDAESVARWAKPFQLGLQSFRKKFWNAAEGCLFDVVDVGHQVGAVDTAFRANQIFAAGGLPFTLLSRNQAKQVVTAVESRLWTPLGLRTLAPGSPNYAGHYGGSPWQRDAAYHQGTAWQWLLGPFIEAWVKTRDDPQAARVEATHQFIEPLLAHRYQAGLNHISEIADGDSPHTSNGCPFQAWSLGELLRISKWLEATGSKHS